MTSAISSFTAPVAPQPQSMQAAATPPDNGFARMLSQRQAMAHDTATTPPLKSAEPAAEPSAPQANTRRADARRAEAPARPPAERQATADKAKPGPTEPSHEAEAAA
ncbi:MAG: hypothetical protein H7Z15_05340, partial [Rhizobacter sp.]|nr:hypothetical protein [Rhizobacter sp.]